MAWHGMACGRDAVWVQRGEDQLFFFFFSSFSKKITKSNELKKERERKETSERKYGGSWKIKV